MRHKVKNVMKRRLALLLSIVILCTLYISFPVTANASTMPERVKVLFDPQGGSAVYGDTVPKNVSIGYMPFPKTVRTGYVFDGWWTQPTGGTKIDCFDGPYTDQLIQRITFTEDSVLYAHWKETTDSQDVTPPLITNVTVLNTDVQKPGIVYVKVDFIEEDTGVPLVEVHILKNGTSGSGTFYYGTFNDGKIHYTGSVVVPVVVDGHAQDGEFKVVNIRIEDQAGNGGNANYEVEVVNEYLLNECALPEIPDLALGKVFQYFPNGRVLTTEAAVNIHDEFDIYTEMALSNPNLVSRINLMPEGKTAKLLIDSPATLPAALFDAIRDKDKRIVAYKDGLQWIFYGKDIINQSKDVKLNVSLSQIGGAEFGQSEDIVMATFEPNGLLPGKATIRLKSDYLYSLGNLKGNLYLYYMEGDSKIVPEAGNIDLHFDGTDKWCYFDITHNSKFLISGAKLVAKQTISATSNNTSYGTVSGGGSFATGTVVTLKATPKAGYRFVRWLEGSTVVSSSYSYAFTVTKARTLKAEFTKIGTPGSFKATSAGYSSIKLTWAAVAGAKEYEIYKATSSSGAYTKDATTALLSYTSTGLTMGKTYYYKVRAKCVAGSITTYGSTTSVVPAKPVLATPTSVKAASASYNSVKVTWGVVSGANGYEIYRASSSTGTYTKVATVTNGSATSYINTNRATGATYYYKVRAYRTVGTAKVYGGYSTVVPAKPVPATPTGAKAASASYNSIKLTWVAVTGAGGYEVYRAATSAGAYTRITTLTSGSTTSYTNASLTTGTTYYYKVRAYRTVGTTRVYGGYSAVVSAKPVPATPTGMKAVRASATSIKLTWSAVTGAMKYEVYRATSSSGTYTKVKEITSAGYTDTGLTTGRTYYYKVRAYRTVGTIKVYGGYSVAVYARP